MNVFNTNRLSGSCVRARVCMRGFWLFCFAQLEKKNEHAGKTI